MRFLLRLAAMEWEAVAAAYRLIVSFENYSNKDDLAIR